MQGLRWFRERARIQYLIWIGVTVVLVASEVTIRIEPRWRAREERAEVEQLAHIATTIDQLRDRIAALEKTDALAFTVTMGQLSRPGGLFDAAAARRQRKQLQEQVDEMLRNQRQILERYRAQEYRR